MAMLRKMWRRVRDDIDMQARREWNENRGRVELINLAEDIWVVWIEFTSSDDQSRKG